MMSKVAKCMLPVVLALPLAAQAQELWQLTSNGDISVESCAYGRGANAVSQAKADGLTQIARVVNSSKLLSVANSRSDMSTATMSYLQQLSSMHQEGMDLQGLTTQLSTPKLQGSDTCVRVTLVRQSLQDDLNTSDWQDVKKTVSVTVIGEGWPDKKGGTARENAELDGLRRAISQVVGVWLTEQRTQFSQSTESISDQTNAFDMQDFVARQLQTKSAGTVKQWRVLDSQTIAPNGIKVTLRADVEKQKLALASSNILQQIGAPRVAVKAPEPLASELKLWLSEQGVEVSNSANLVLDAKHRLIHRSSTSRLDLSVNVTDRAGNLYGRWVNDPSLLALPTSDSVLTDLIAVNLASDEQLESLQKQIASAFMRVVKEGGLIHDVYINSLYLTKPERLSSVLSTLGGASDVSVSHDGETYKAQLRFSGKTGELVAALQQSLQPIIKSPLPKATINNEFTIRFN